MDAKMKELLAAKKYYEFGQYIKGTMSRKIARKKYQEYEALILEALEQLIVIKEENMIIDIGEDYLFNFKKFSTEYNRKFIEFITKVFLNGRKGRRIQFLEKVLYQTEGKIKEFYGTLSDAYASAADYKKAYRYALKSLQLDKIYPSLNQLIKEGNPSEKDLFIFRGLLELLYSSSLDLCPIFYANYSAELKQSPLNQLYLWIVHAIKIKSFAAFKELVIEFSSQYERDDDLIRYMDKVAQIYFGQTILEQEGFSKVLGNMLKMINQPQQK